MDLHSTPSTAGRGRGGAAFTQKTGDIMQDEATEDLVPRRKVTA